jgi:membrane protease YdiL (CAAX protease family)
MKGSGPSSPRGEPRPEPRQRSLLARIFLSPEEERLRAGWRLTAHFVLLGFIILGLTIPVSIASQALQGMSPTLTGGVFAALAMTISVYLARGWFDKRTFKQLGAAWSRQSGAALLQGVGIGGAIMALIFLVEWGAGWLKIEGVGWAAMEGMITGEIVEWLLLFVLVGWYEELYFRGYIMTNVGEGINPAWGLALSTLYFSATHLNNPFSSPASLMGITAAGLFLGYAYVRAGNLWLPVGLHIGWNVFEGVVFGFPVSGIDTAAFVQQSASGPEIITGGHFGPEAGLILLPALLLGTWLIQKVTE